MKAKSALSLALAAGFAGTAMASSPTTLSPSQGNVVKAAHIYFNIATGERIITVLGDNQTAGADNGVSCPIWSSIVADGCSDAGYTTTWFFGVDNNAGTTSLATDITNLDMGDVALDTVVDCVHLDWVTAHVDTDADSDGIGDGVEGLGGEWTYWDADNGRTADKSTRLPIINFILGDLPGNIFGAGSLTGYTADIDLAGAFTGSDLTFEIGDSDGDLQGASFGNNNVDTNSDGIGDGVSVAAADRNFDGLPDSDLDGDGLFDWAWTVRFSQPGTRDLDGDGVIDGDIADSMLTIGISFGSGAGTSVDNGDATWNWDADTTAVDGATGQEDAFAIYAPPFGGGDGDILHAGFFWFGGYACEGVPVDEIDPDTGMLGLGWNPLAAFEHQIFGPSGVCPDAGCDADLTDDGSLNFFDVSLFLSLFGDEDPLADFTDDGSWNFFDVSEFLSQYAAGCDG